MFDVITTMAEAEIALGEFRAARFGSVAGLVGALYAPKGQPQHVEPHQFTSARAEKVATIFSELDRHPGPGPGLQVAQNGSQRLLGHPEDSRGLLTIRLPEMTAYGPVLGDPVVDLDRLVTDHRLVCALAARLDLCAQSDTENNRTRQASLLYAEANELMALTADLEALVEPVGFAFLDYWRAESARWWSPPIPEPDPTPGPVFRPAQIRRAR